MSPVNHLARHVRYARAALVACLAATACTSGARYQITTAEALDALTAEVTQAVNEYHLEVRAADAERRRAAVDAFADRLRADHDKPDATRMHVQRFNQALDRLQTDAEAENERLHATLDNLAIAAQAAAGMRRIAVQSMTLNDEVRRYLTTRLAPRPQDAQPEGK